MKIAALTLIAAALLGPLPSLAQDAPLRIEITEGVVRPMPVTLRFEDAGGAAELTAEIAAVIAADLQGTGLFEMAEPEGAPDTGFDRTVDYIAWKTTGTEALVTGQVIVDQDNVSLRFRLFDVFAGQPLGDGMQFVSPREGWRRAASGPR